MAPVRTTSNATVISRTPSVAATGGSTAPTVQTGVSSLTKETRAIRPGGTRPILRDNPPPRKDAGHEFCVAWWTRGTCFDNCRRRVTHVPFVRCRTHPPAEFLSHASRGTSGGGKSGLTGKPGAYRSVTGRRRGISLATHSTPWVSHGRKRAAEEISQALTEAEATLGKWATATAVAVQREGFAAVVRRLRGRPNITEGVHRIPPKASRLLQHLRRKGASVWTTTLPWSTERCDEAVRRGSHKSAHEDRGFVFE